MAVYTLQSVTFSAAQEAALDRKLFLHNQARAAQNPPLAPVTKPQYLDALVQAWPSEFTQEFREDFRARCADAMQIANVPTLQTVATALGVDVNPYD